MQSYYPAVPAWLSTLPSPDDAGVASASTSGGAPPQRAGGGSRPAGGFNPSMLEALRLGASAPGSGGPASERRPQPAQRPAGHQRSHSVDRPTSGGGGGGGGGGRASHPFLPTVQHGGGASGGPGGGGGGTPGTTERERGAHALSDRVHDRTPGGTPPQARYGRAPLGGLAGGAGGGGTAAGGRDRPASARPATHGAATQAQGGTPSGLRPPHATVRDRGGVRPSTAGQGLRK
jgi:hypothetical protein